MGVPQDSFFGPFLFTLCLDNFTSCYKLHQDFLYVDVAKFLITYSVSLKKIVRIVDFFS